MSVELASYQLKAIDELKNGSILCGGVGSGKSRTELAYYVFKVCGGDVKVIDYPDEGLPWEEHSYHQSVKEMTNPRDLYIITTAKKRDSKEWEKECSNFMLNTNPELSLSEVKVTVDSWNNINKYTKVYGAFFIFDEQRVVGSGSWVKAFLKITKKNQWNLLSATPGDQWSDYIPVFVANGFFQDKSDFTRNHCIYSPYTKYPKIERYIGERKLETLRSKILVQMEDQRKTVRHNEYVIVDYDRSLYRTVMKDRWDPYDNCPIEETGKLVYLIRKVCYSNYSRITALDKIMKDKKCVIVFYNFTYELEMLREYAEEQNIKYAEWNSKKHQDLPIGESWLYFVQYAAGSEGWNCTTTDTIVLFSQTYSYKNLEQACGRIDRMNTPFIDLYYYHLRCNSPIDIAIWSTLKNKKKFNERSFIRRQNL